MSVLCVSNLKSLGMRFIHLISSVYICFILIFLFFFCFDGRGLRGRSEGEADICDSDQSLHRFVLLRGGRGEVFGKRTWSSLYSIGGMDGQGRGLITD